MIYAANHQDSHDDRQRPAAISHGHVQRRKHPADGLDSAQKPLDPARVVLHLYRIDETDAAHQQGPASGFAKELRQICQSISVLNVIRFQAALQMVPSVGRRTGGSVRLGDGAHSESQNKKCS